MKKLMMVVFLMVSMFFVFGTQAQAVSLDRAIVAVSVDDGDYTLYDNVYPLAREYKIPFTAYIVTSYVGDGTHVTWSRLHSMQRSGLCEVGNHSRSHKSLSSQPYETILAEVRGAQNTLIAHGFFRVVSFSFPFGGTSYNVLKAVKEVGLTNARGAWGERNNFNFPATFSRFWIESVSYRFPMTHADIKPLIDKAVADKAGLSIVLHKVFPGAKGDYELDSVELEKTLAYLAELRGQGKLRTKNVSQMCEELMYYNRLR